MAQKPSPVDDKGEKRQAAAAPSNCKGECPPKSNRPKPSASPYQPIGQMGACRGITSLGPNFPHFARFSVDGDFAMSKSEEF